MKPKFYAQIKEQKILFSSSVLQVYRNYLKTLEGKEIELTICKRKKGRSNQQNRYYWGVCMRLMADELGYEAKDIHYEMRRKFLSQLGEKLEIPTSTTLLSTIEFNEYIEKVRQFSSQELSIYIPDPNEVEFEN